MLINEEPLSEATVKIVRRHLSKVLLAGLTSFLLGNTVNNSAYPRLCKVNERVFWSDVLSVLVLLEVTLYIRREVGVSRLPTAADRVLPGVDVKPVLSAVALR